MTMIMTLNNKNDRRIGWLVTINITTQPIYKHDNMQLYQFWTITSHNGNNKRKHHQCNNTARKDYSRQSYHNIMWVALYGNITY
jgi:hypothetical protein